MGCCGQSVTSAVSQPARSTTTTPRVLFEYRGQAALVVYGRVTGIRYHFPGPTARVSVDGRDAPYLQVVGGLEVIDAVP